MKCLLKKIKDWLTVNEIKSETTGIKYIRVDDLIKFIGKLLNENN